MIDRQFSNELCAAWRQADELYSRWAEQHHVGYFTLLMLWLLHDTDGGLTQKRISRYYGWPKQTTNSVTRALQQQGLVALTPGETDRREKLVTLTEAGRRYAEELLQPLAALEDRVYGDMDEGRLRDMLRTLRLFTILFEKELEQDV